MNRPRKTLTLPLLCLALLQLAVPAFASLAFTFNQGTDIAATASSYTASGALDLTLGFAPTPGQNLTVVKNTGPAFISGNFDAIPQGATVPLTFNGVTYNYLADYFGGNGRSLVLHWPLTGLAAWGSNQYGQLGNRGISDQSAPVDVFQRGAMAGAVVTQIDGGLNHTLALSIDGRIFAWGDNSVGQLGDGGMIQSNAPVAVDLSGALAGKRLVAVSGGNNFSLVLDSDGLAYGWGQNYTGNLGKSGIGISLVPTAVETDGVLNGKKLTAIAAGYRHALALSSEGKVYAWGSNDNGGLGNNGTNSNSYVPVAVDTSGVLDGKTIVAIDASYYSSLALSSDGQVFSWGYNGFKQLGIDGIFNSLVPVAVDTSGAMAGTTIVAIAAGESYNQLALASDGRIFTWGTNIASATGIVQSGVPIEVDTGGVLVGKTVVAISARSSRCTVLTSDGMVFLWQQDEMSGSLVPMVASGDSAAPFVSAITGGASHSVELWNADPPEILMQPWGRTLAEGQTATFTSRASNAFLSTVQWQVSPTGPAGPFADITGNPTATTGTLSLESIAASQDGHAFRAIFSNASGSRVSEPAKLALVTWSATLSNATDVPFQGDAITASGNLDLQLGFAPVPGTDLTVIRNRGTEFISGAFANVSQGGTVSLTYNSVTYDYVADYFGGNGRSLVLHWPRTRLMAWGNNGIGQLGTGSYAPSLIPTEASTPAGMHGKITKLAASERFSMALTADGRVFTWGDNGYNHLGTNTATPNLPGEVTAAGALAGKTVVAISATSSHCLTLTSEGRIHAWGLNRSGQLGIGSTDFLVPTPVEIPPAAFDGQPVVSISACNDLSMALTADGRVFAWGSNYFGKTGNGSMEQTSPAPTEIITSENLKGLTFVDIAAGEGHGLALAADGRLFAWGDPKYTGTNSQGLEKIPPTPVDMSGALSGKTITRIATGGHTLVLTSDGSVIGWGLNGYGQLGIGTTTDAPLPIAINGGALAGKTVSSISCGDGQSAVTTTDGEAFTWGTNDDGQLGDGTTDNRSLPVAVSNGSKFISIAAGGTHTLALVDAGPPHVISQPLSRTAAAGVDVSFTAGATDPYGFEIQWQVSTSGPAGPFLDVADNATASTSTLVIGNVTAAQNHWAWRAVFSNISGSSITTPAVLDVVTWSGTFTSATSVPNQATNPIVSGVLDLHLDFAPSRGTSLTLLQNTGLSFIAGTFVNLPQGRRITLPFGGSNYDFIVNYFGGNGHSLVLQWPWLETASWGKDYDGQLGVTPQGDRNTPTASAPSAVAGDAIWAAAAAGDSHTLMLALDGRIFSRGNNNRGQLGNGSTTSTSSLVAADSSGVLAGKTIVAVCGGLEHTLALSSSGEVFAWGLNFYGQLGDRTTFTRTTPVAVASDGSLAGKLVTAIATGGNFSLALTEDGKVHSWGSYEFAGPVGAGPGNLTGPVDVDTSGVLAGKTVTAIASGHFHKLVLTSDGHVYAWGQNYYGQLGTNDTTSRWVPVAVTTSGAMAGKTVISIAAGMNYSVALTADGEVFSWGENSYGQLGDHSTISRSTPVLVGIGSPLAGQNVIQISAGDCFCLAQTADGKLFSWGLNSSGQLGIGTTVDSAIPVQVNSSGLLAGKALTGLSTGGGFAIAQFAGEGLPVVTASPEDRSVIQSGPDSATLEFSAAATDLFPLTVHWQVSPTGPDGAFGDIEGNASASTATLILHDIPQNLDGSAYRAVFTNNNGSVATSAATLTLSTITAPFAFTSPSDVLGSAETPFVFGTLDLALGYAPTPGTDLTVIRNTGTGFITGSFSNLIQGAILPLTFGGISHRFVVDYYGGRSGRDLVLHWAEILTAAWGDGSSGQVGAGKNSSNNHITVAVDATGVMAGQTVVKLAAGTSHSLALAASGRIFAWGSNGSGRLGNGTTASSNVPVEVDATGVLAGKQVIAIAAGDAHSLALTSDGQVAAWGSNVNYTLGTGDQFSHPTPVAVSRAGVLADKTVTAIAAGLTHSVALTSDGTVVAWGSNDYGQLGNDTPFSSAVPVAVDTSFALAGKTVVAIAAGGNHTLVLTTEGRVYSWGANKYGQLGRWYSSAPTPNPAAIFGSGLIAGKTIVSIVAGASHSLAVTSDGMVYAWGLSDQGQLGYGSTSFNYVPTAIDMTGVLAGKSVVTVSAGGIHSLAITSDGLGFAWGDNNKGRLGINLPRTPYSPVALAMSTQGAIGSRPLIAIAAGGSHSLAIVGRGTAPSVIGSPDSRTVVADSTVTFTAAGDGYPAPTVRWQRSITGPGGTFTDLSGETATTLELTNVPASQTGYAYRAVFTNLEASTNSAAATLTVQPTFATFLVSRSLPTDSQPLDDLYKTGVNHLLAYAFNLDPAAPDRSKLPTATSVEGHLQISYTRWKNAADLHHTVEVSNGLDSWLSGSGVTEIVSVTSLDNTRETVVEQEILPDPTPARFLRVRVELVAP